MTAKRFFQALAALSAVGLAACFVVNPEAGFFGSTEGEPVLESSGAQALPAAGYYGGVVADEPRAALLAREALREGGNAADAAAALYLGLAVTYPSRASLGGGGACLVADPEHGQVRALDFMPRDGPLPANVQGMAALQAQYGRLRWQRLVAPAESLARFGFPVSRALAADLHGAAQPLLSDPGFSALFGSADGGPLKEGEELVQPELADTLARIRLEGAAGFASGQGAARLADAAARVGSALDPATLAAFKPRWEETVRLAYRDATLHTLPPPAMGGIAALNLWQLLAAHDRYAKTPPPERPHLLVEASVRAFAASADNPPKEGQAIAAERLDEAMADYRADAHTGVGAAGASAAAAPDAATSFVVIDKDGMAVVCGFALDAPFGTGRIAPGTGILLAGPGTARGNGMALVLMLAQARPDVVFAVGASGGSAAPDAAVSVMLSALLDGQPLKQAMARVRLSAGGAPDATVLEPGFPESVLDGLKSRGHALESDGLLGRVNAAFCPRGAKSAPGSCAFDSDIRGFGAALSG